MGVCVDSDFVLRCEQKQKQSQVVMKAIMVFICSRV